MEEIMLDCLLNDPITYYIGDSQLPIYVGLTETSTTIPNQEIIAWMTEKDSYSKL